MSEAKKFTIFDFSIFLLIIGCVAFSDIDIFCIGAQFVAIAISLFHVVRRRSIASYLSNTFLWVGFFFLLCLTSGLWAFSNNRTVLSSSIAFAQMGCILLTLIVYCYSEEKYLKLIRYVEIGALLICIRFFLTVSTSQWGSVYLSLQNSIFSDNITAMTLAYVAVIIVWECFIYRKSTTINKMISIVFSAVLIFIVLMMGTKKGVFIFGIGLIILYLSQSKNVIKSAFRIMLALIAVYVAYLLLINVPLLYSAVGNRVELMLGGITGGVTDASTRTRMLFIENAFDVFKENPLVGIGIDGFRYVNKYQFTYSHNNYTEILADLGLLGFIAYYSIFVVWIRRGWAIAKSNILPLALIVIMLVMDWSLVSYSSETKAIWMGLSMIPLYSLKIERKDSVVPIPTLS